MINQSNTYEVKNRVGSKSCHNNAPIDTFKEEAHTNFSYENQTLSHLFALQRTLSHFYFCMSTNNLPLIFTYTHMAIQTK